MRQRFILAGLVMAVVGAAVVAIAQSPAPPSASLPPVVIVPPAEPVPPGLPRSIPPAPTSKPAQDPAPADAQLARFEPLVAQPHQTQAAVRAVLLGANWMTRMNQPQGRFQYGYNPALQQPIPGDHDLKQARAARALARSARFCGDEKQAAIASQAILALLAATKIDPADPNGRIPVPSSLDCNRVGFAAVLALAIYELPAADTKLIAEAERLCVYLHKQCRSDGSVDYAEGVNEPAKLDPAGLNEYPGAALQAIIVGNRVQPAPWKAEVVNRGLMFYRAKFKAQPHPLLAATLTPAATELYRQTKSNEAAALVFELNDWLCGLQISAGDTRAPQWAGGFRSLKNGHPSDDPPGPEVGYFLESLACAYEINRHVPDLTRNSRYKAALLDATQFLCGLQYVEANTRHFENIFRANTLIGGFHLSPLDGNLHIDSTGIAVTGLLQFLSSGAEK